MYNFSLNYITFYWQAAQPGRNNLPTVKNMHRKEIVLKEPYDVNYIYYEIICLASPCWTETKVGMDNIDYYL